MLWTTTAGMIDFLIFAAVVSSALWRGERHIKGIACVAVAAFAMDRFTMLAFDPATFIHANMWGTAAAIWAVLLFKQHLSARGYAALYVGKILALTLLSVGVISFETMATVSTVVVYGQIFILLGGASYGTGLGSSFGSIGRRIRLLASVAGGRQAKRYGASVESSVGPSQDAGGENSQKIRVALNG